MCHYFWILQKLAKDFKSSIADISINGTFCYCSNTFGSLPPVMEHSVIVPTPSVVYLTVFDLR